MRYFITLRSALSTVTIKDESDNILYKVKSAKKISFGYNVVMVDSNGNELYTITKKGLGSKYKILKNDSEIATIKKAMSLLKPKVSIESSSGHFSIKGNYNKHKYTLSKKNKEVATVSKKMINLKNVYFFDCNESNDIELLLAIAVVLDNLAYEHEQSLQRGDDIE